MGRNLSWTILLCSITHFVFSQCPDLPNNTTLNGSTATSIAVCGSESFTFATNATNLPTGTIDWYSGGVSGFDPLTEGSLLGSSTVTSSLSECSNCPAIEALYIDVCNNSTDSEEDNEFMIVSSGSGFAVDNFSLLFPSPAFGSPDSDINTGDLCGWTDGDLSLVSGCGADVIAVGPGDYIPANSIVVIQTSTTGTITYDLSPICGTSECIYILQNACDRNSAGFKNCDASGTRTVTVELTCGCSNALTYDINAICVGGGGGTYITDEGMIGNSGCTTSPPIIAPSPLSYNSNTNPFSWSFSAAECNTTQYVVGVLNSAQQNTDCCGATQSQTNEYSIDVSCASAEISQDQDGILCPGDCETITISFTGGSSPYNLNMNLATTAPFPFNNIPLPIPGFPVDQKLTICYDNGGPPYDPSTFTVDVPAIVTGNGTLSLNGFTDANGCMGTVTGSSITLSFNEKPSIVTPPPFQECDMGGGMAFFILTNYDNIINGNSGLSVNYFLDDMGLMPISSPYETSTTTIYAQVDGDPCDSDIVPIDLEVILNGDAGLVTFFCTDDMGSDDMCTICDDDGTSGEDVVLTIIFEDPAQIYQYEVEWTAISGPSSTITGSSTPGTGTAMITFTVFETTTFEVTTVTGGGCPDMTDLGDVVTVDYSLEPQMDDPGALMSCGPITLPPIAGDIVPANAAYFSAPNGGGQSYAPGDMISTSTTIYLYAGIMNCEQEIPIDISIGQMAMIDDPGDVTECGSYTLPPITGTNVDNAQYFTEQGGGGSVLPPGQVITSNITLYIFDNVCGGNEVEFDIAITAGAVITTGPDTIVCDTMILTQIEGTSLTGNEGYYSQPGGQGMQIPLGDTITQDTLIYIYDNSPGCEIDVAYNIRVGTAGYPGEDASVALCQGDPMLYNLSDLLNGSTPDTVGHWIELNTNIVSDSSMVDFSVLAPGQYEYEYMIADSICGDTSSHLIVTILGVPNAGADFVLPICQDVAGIHMLDSLAGADLGGTFYDDAGVPISFDPTDASFSSGAAGQTTYQYVVGDETSSCGADTATFTVVTGQVSFAGSDVSETVCVGLTINLPSLLTDASAVGTFIEPVISGGLAGSTFNSNLVADGQPYTIYHVLAGSGPCPADTATIIITVVDGPSAGDENAALLCGDDSIDLASLINGDLGGDFYFGATLLSSSVVTYTTESGTLEYAYIIGDGVGCPFDTATLTIERSVAPPVSIDISETSICPEECTSITIATLNTGGQQITISYHISGSDGSLDNRTYTVVDFTPDLTIDLCEGTGLLSDDIVMAGQSYEVVIDSVRVTEANSDCVFDIGELVSFEVLEGRDSLITGTYCAAAQVVVGPDVYDINMPTGMTSLVSQDGCDSTVTVDLQFLTSVSGNIDTVLCDGQTVEILGIIYDSSYQGDTLLMGGSAGGCDSLLMINITVGDAVMSALDTTVCPDFMINVNGQIYDINNAIGQETLSGQSASGCDSTVTINLTFLEEAMSTLDTMVCGDFSIVVGGVTYDADMPTGMEILEGQSSNGCDSIVLIDLDFSQTEIDSLIQFSTCDNNLFLVIGGEVFNRTRPSGMSTISSTTGGCDTLVTVDITYGEMEVDFELIDASCMSPDTGSVVIQWINGVGPFDIRFNGNNAIVELPTLPYQIDLPVGSGSIDVIDINPASGGCMTTIDYDILQGIEGEYSISRIGDQLFVNGPQPDSVLWTPSTGLSCTDCTDPIASPEATTIYTAMVWYGGDCEVTLTYIFEVDDNIPDYILPNIFSPNGDGANENFTLQITEGVLGIPASMRIYDRWGNLIYSSIDPAEIVDRGWDGTFNGSNVTPGVYIYQVSIREGERTINLYGDLTVVR